MTDRLKERKKEKIDKDREREKDTHTEKEKNNRNGIVREWVSEWVRKRKTKQIET